MKARLALLFVLVAALGVLVAPVGAAAAQPSAGIQIPVSGTVPGVSSFTGTYTLDRITRTADGGLQAVGSLTGTLTNLVSGATSTVTNVPVNLPLTGATGSCQILHLELGPLDLDLLGLQVHLDQIVLDITAQSGPGNLLGNLLCAVAHLLDQNGLTGGLQGLLNQILAILGGL
jgi:hypothetical protein